MKDVLAIILGGGKGTRLYPLTKFRAKPAITIAGSYRLIDIPISNCLNSEITKIFVLTQYNSVQLNRHINLTYHSSVFSKGFVEALSAQQTADDPHWFQGTADAVRQYLDYLESFDCKDIIILSGDHVYCMDYRPFLQHHRAKQADITISAIRVDRAHASRYGLLRIQPDTGTVVDFAEKPQGARLQQMRNENLETYQAENSIDTNGYIASMGVYIFRQPVLKQILTRHPGLYDFGHEVIPHSLTKFKVHTFLYNEFWEDIGTIEAYYATNLRCLEHPESIFNCYDASKPLYTRQRYLPPAHIMNGDIQHSKICDGTIIQNAKIKKSIIGIRTVIGNNVHIEDSIIQGAHFYQSKDDQINDQKNGIPPVGICDGTSIHKAIIDKDARIGKNVKIINSNRITDKDAEQDGYVIRDGIVVVMDSAIIPDNTVI